MYDEPDAGEDPQRLTRNLNELLQELRVAQAGVQILFGFLLSLPFAARFEATDRAERVIYFVALLATASATAMLIAPVAYHRILFRRRRRPELIKVANRSAISGLGLMVLGVSAAVTLVSSYLLDRAGGWLVGGAVFVFFAGWWFLVPLASLVRHPVVTDPSPAPDRGDR